MLRLYIYNYTDYTYILLTNCTHLHAKVLTISSEVIVCAGLELLHCARTQEKAVPERPGAPLEIHWKRMALAGQEFGGIWRQHLIHVGCAWKWLDILDMNILMRELKKQVISPKLWEPKPRAQSKRRRICVCTYIYIYCMYSIYI